ncbi:hypothetical protein PV327_000760 [Microctonus hyperodae]|uniref:G-protein coupled receptors family 1 profile domain-containing protein n=1 Tax=Microctonus hyperodae TaxID=165561 RepID=A0AA39G7T5_MICHY|nr:hypothetical protein PV327_000760 [Microctonus hyperodae]
MGNATNITDGRDENLILWEISVLSTILIVTLIGNFLVLFAVYLEKYYGYRKKATRMYFFMKYLSIADLMTGVFNVLPQLAWNITSRFQGGAVLCKVIKFIQPFGNYLSSYVLIATAIDRYHAICYPLSYCRTTSKISKRMIYGAWCLAFILCIPQIIVFSYQEVEINIWDCWASFVVPYGERAYVTWFSTTVFLIPFIVLLYTYTGICLSIWRNSEINQFEGNDCANTMNSSDSNRHPLVSKARINTVKQTITVISLYIVTNSPFIGCQLWATWDPYASESSFFTGETFRIFALLSSLTSCVNPWIYLGFNRNLRATIPDEL